MILIKEETANMRQMERIDACLNGLILFIKKMSLQVLDSILILQGFDTSCQSREPCPLNYTVGTLFVSS